MKKFTLVVLLSITFFSSQALLAQCDANINDFDFIGEFEDHYYYTSLETADWENARTIAAANGGYLASINSQAENDFLTSAINEIVFIGFNDFNTNGSFVWDSEEVVGYNNLATTNSSDVFYGNMNFWNGEWSLDGIYVARKFLLEIDCDDVGGCPDADNDGTCDNDDCQPNNPSFPTVVGASCDDTNTNTTNDVIQSDGCTCAGIPIASSCSVAINSSDGGVTITGLTSEANTKLFDSNTNSVWECNPWNGNPCSSIETVTGLTTGATYFLSVQSNVCSEWIPVTIIGNGGGDPSCFDGIQNQGETNVDCGGPCVPCDNGGGNDGSIQLLCQENREAFTNLFTGGYYKIDYADLTNAISDCVANAADVLFISDNPNYAQGKYLATGNYDLSVEIIDRCGNKAYCNFNLDVIDSNPTNELPDIVLSTLRISNTSYSSIRAGQLAEVSFTIDNYGGQIFQNVNYNIYLSDSGNSLTNATLLGTFSRQGLNGESRTSGFKIVEFPQNAVPGEYFLVVNADSNNSISESDEANNITSRAITIRETQVFDDYCAFELFAGRANEIVESLVGFSVQPSGSGVQLITNYLDNGSYTFVGGSYDNLGNLLGGYLAGVSLVPEMLNYSYGYSVNDFYGPSRFVLSGASNINTIPNSQGVALTEADADIEEMIDIQIAEARDHLLIYGVYRTTANTYRSFIMKTTLRGTVFWQQIQDPSQAVFELQFLEESETDGYYFLKKGDNLTGSAFQRFDTQGNLIWNHIVENEVEFIGETNDNNQFVYSQTNNGMIELVTLNAGSGISESSINLASILTGGQTSIGQSVDGILITDFGFVVSATIDNNISTYAKLDQNGNVIWTANFPEGKEKSIPQFITPDGGIVFGKILENKDGTIAFYVNDEGEFAPECVEPPSQNNCVETIDGYEFLGTYNDSYYFIANEVDTWLGSRYSAFLSDAYLVEIGDQAENDFLQSVIDEVVYIGFSDRLYEGSPKWVNLEASIWFQNFDTGCDDCTNTAEKDYVQMHPWNGKWSWSLNEIQRRAIMEVPCVPQNLNPTISMRGDNSMNSFKTDPKSILQDWRISPNPASNHLNIDINLDQSITTTIEIINANGQLMYQQSQTLIEGFNTVELVIDALPIGIYFVRIPGIQTEGKRFIKVN